MLILLRHGRTRANAAGLLQGRLDLSLDPVGRAQAAAAAAHIGPVDRVVSSPLQRARETANAFGVDTLLDDRWSELDYGDLESVPVADVPESTWAAWRADVAFVPAGGESLEALSERVCAALDDLAAEAETRDVVVVSHVSPIKAAIAWTLGVGVATQWRMHLGQAAICRIAVRGGQPTLLSFNERSHL